jgi:hypothetical protein
METHPVTTKGKENQPTLCPAEAEGLKAVFAVGDGRTRSRSQLLEVYGQIFGDRASWDDNHPPRTVAVDEIVEIPEHKLESWKEEARSLAISGYRLIIEDGPDLSDSSEDDQQRTGVERF